MKHRSNTTCAQNFRRSEPPIAALRSSNARTMWLRFVVRNHGASSCFFLATCFALSLWRLGLLSCISLIAAEYQNSPLSDVCGILRHICVLDTRSGYSWQSKSHVIPLPISSLGATYPLRLLAAMSCFLKAILWHVDRKVPFPR